MLIDSKLTQRQIKDFEIEINQQIETLSETTRDEIEQLRVQMKVCPCQLLVIEATIQLPERTFHTRILLLRFSWKMFKVLDS